MREAYAQAVFRLLPLSATNRDGLRRVLGSTAWLSADSTLRLGLGVLVTVLVARHLGPEQFGTYSYVLAFVALFTAFAPLGLDSVVVRDIVRYPALRDEILGTTFGLKLSGGLLALSFALLAGRLLHADAQLLLLIGLGATGALFQPFDTIGLWFRSQVQARQPVYAKSFAFLLSSGAKLALVIGQAPLPAFILTGPLELALTGLGFMLLYHLQGNLVRTWKWRLGRAHELLRESWPLALSGIVIMIYMRIGQIMIEHLASTRDVGIYSAAMRISEVWYVLPVAVVNSVFPSIVQSKAADDALYRQRVQQIFTLLSLVGYGVAIAITFLSTPIIQLTFGTTYLDASPALAIHVWTGVFVALGVARDLWTIPHGLSYFTLGTTALGALCSVVLNLVLIPTHGAVGASISALAAQAISVCLSTAILPATRPLFKMQIEALLLIPLYRRWGNTR